MFYIQKFISTLIILITIKGQGYSQTLGKETILIQTSCGNMKVKLYEETPLHKANFLKLIEGNFFDSLLFHRVINNFMIQGGDPLSKKAKPGDSLGHGDIGYTIPAEINEKLIHKKGTLCAAREGDDINPKFESSASQFYLVMGKKRSSEDLHKYEDRINKTRYTNCARALMKSDTGRILKQAYNRLKAENKADSAAMINARIESLILKESAKSPAYQFNGQQTAVYTSVGGTPHLDGTYTVFGEVTEGLDVIDKIAAVKTDQRDRPLKDIRMKITLIN